MDKPTQLRPYFKSMLYSGWQAMRAYAVSAPELQSLKKLVLRAFSLISFQRKGRTGRQPPTEIKGAINIFRYDGKAWLPESERLSEQERKEWIEATTSKVDADFFLNLHKKGFFAASDYEFYLKEQGREEASMAVLGHNRDYD